MSFSSTVKNEITKNTEITRAEIIARSIGHHASFWGRWPLGQAKLSFKITTENPSTARFIFKLLKDHLKIHGRLL